MRLHTVFTLVSVILFATGGFASAREPEVRAPISHEDVRQIIRTIRAVTPKPVTFIDTVYNDKWPHHPRFDIVRVNMGEDSGTGKGDVYIVEKKKGRWQITGKTFWIR
jgi:hypothetical protein